MQSDRTQCTGSPYSLHDQLLVTELNRLDNDTHRIPDPGLAILVTIAADQGRQHTKQTQQLSAKLNSFLTEHESSLSGSSTTLFYSLFDRTIFYATCVSTDHVRRRFSSPASGCKKPGTVA
jgi:hypothetical protein